MKKIYLLLIVLTFVMTTYASQHQAIKKRNHAGIENKKTQFSQKQTKKSLRSTQLSTEEQTIYPDSVITYDMKGNITGSDYFTYDSENRILSEEFCEIEDDNTIYREKNAYEYDNRGNKTSKLNFEWKNGKWENDYKEIREYNTNDNEISSEEYRWINNRWAERYKRSYEFGTNGHMIYSSYISYTTDEEADITKPTYKSSQYYHSQFADLQTGEEQYKWENNEWILIFKGELKFNTNRDIVSDINYQYNEESGIQPYMQMISVYDDLKNTLSSKEVLYWENEDWIHSFKEVYAYDPNNNITNEDSFYWNPESENWQLSSSYKYDYAYYADNSIELITRSYKTDDEWKAETKTLFEYDVKKNKILIEEQNYRYNSGKWATTSKIIQEFDSNNNQTLIESYRSDYWNDNELVGESKNISAFDNEGNRTLYEYYSWDEDKNNWKGSGKTVSAYDKYGNQTLYEYYSWDEDKNNWRGSYKDIEIYNAEGVQTGYEEYRWNNDKSIWEKEFKNVGVFAENGTPYMAKNYIWVNNEWQLNSYVFAYPYYLEFGNKVETGEVSPVGDDKKGIFELAYVMPSDATITGSFEIEFPKGITLDTENTKLNNEFSADFYLYFTDKGNNKWTIEIKKKGTRSISSNDVLKKIVDIAYIVQEEINTGTYKIVINNIDFKLSDDSLIKQDQVSFNVEIGNDTGIGSENISEANVFFTDDILYIDSPIAERVNVYSVNGLLLHSAEKEAGQISISNLPKGIVIVKCNSGWARKAINN